MTENESNLLEYYERTVKECMEECDCNCIMCSEGNCECVDYNVLDHLRELQQYRAIGTVEELQNMKDHLLMVKGMCKDYYEIGTIEEFKALKEKNEPKKIEKRGYVFVCPICKKWLQSQQENCHGCGQKLAWSE